MEKRYQNEIKLHYPMIPSLNFLGKGMEGTVWKTADGFAYKKFINIGYHEYEKSKLNKIQLLNNMTLNNCCIPHIIVVDKQESLLGYLMDLKTRAYYIHKLKIEDQIHILSTVLTMIEEQRNLPIPIYNLDLSFQNIFIDKNKCPIFIDLDNFYVDHLPPESFPPKLKYCTHIHYCEHLYDFQLLCFSLYIVEVISRTDIDFSLKRGIPNIQHEVHQKINEIIKKYHFDDKLTEQFLLLFRRNYREVTIEELSSFLNNLENHINNIKQKPKIKQLIKR